MKIAIIGTGNVGGALATQWAKAGHQIPHCAWLPSQARLNAHFQGA
jgi:predicted dinucleotide-binding enzyme